MNEGFLPKEDKMFKSLFGSEWSVSYLKSFIESALDINIKSLKLNNKEKINNPKGGKTNYLDILTTLDDGTKVNVEMQSINSPSFEKRVLEYWAQVYLDKAKKGVKYDNLSKTIGIWILDQNWIKEVENYHTKWKVKEETLLLSGHFDEIEIHLLELPKLRKYAKMNSSKLTKLEKWLGFIDFTDKELVDMAVRTEEDIREAMKKYEELLEDTEMLRLYHYEWDQKALQNELLSESKKQGLEEGRKEGFEKGIKQNKIENAKRLLKKGVDIQIIAECTDLSIERVKELQKELK